VILDVLSSSEDRLFGEIVQREELFRKLSALYSSKSSLVISQANNLVAFLVRSINRDNNCIFVLKKHALIKLFFNKCNELDEFSAKKALKLLHEALMALKKSD
jgi:hypothetical protein